jgi:hypothetical protein
LPGGDVLVEAFVRRMQSDGFNTLFVSDTTGYDEAGRSWRRMAADDIARVYQMARRHRMNVIVLLTAVEYVRDPQVFDRWTNRYLSNDELLARYELWRNADRGATIGILLLGDDPFYLRVPAAVQRGWAATLRGAGNDIPLLGLLGEFSLATSQDTIAAYWDEASFDHLVLVSYCYNLGRVWGHTLDHVASSDPDGDVRRYEHEYVAALRQRLPATFTPDRVIVPVIQAFAYQGDAAGAVPRDSDLSLQIRAIHRELHEQLSQSQNTAMGVFFAGQARGNGINDPPSGVYDNPAWPPIVAAENARLAAEQAGEHDP